MTTPPPDAMRAVIQRAYRRPFWLPANEDIQFHIDSDLVGRRIRAYTVSRGGFPHASSRCAETHVRESDLHISAMISDGRFVDLMCHEVDKLVRALEPASVRESLTFAWSALQDEAALSVYADHLLESGQIHPVVQPWYLDDRDAKTGAQASLMHQATLHARNVVGRPLFEEWPSRYWEVAARCQLPSGTGFWTVGGGVQDAIGRMRQIADLRDLGLITDEQANRMVNTTYEP